MKKTNISLLLAVLLASVTTNSVMSKEDCQKNCEKHESWHQRHKDRVKKEQDAHEARKKAHHDRVMAERHHEVKKECASEKCGKKMNDKQCSSGQCDKKRHKNKNEGWTSNANPVDDVVRKLPGTIFTGHNKFNDENSAE